MVRKNNQEKKQIIYWNREAKHIASVTVNMSNAGKKELRDFFSFMNIKRKSNILDVGCGAGRLTIPLLKANHSVTGTEIAVKNLKEIKRLSKKEKIGMKLTLIETTLEKPIGRNRFDVAICCNVIHHFNPIKKKTIMENITKSLKRGGTIAIIEPNPLHFLYYLRYLQVEITGQDRGRWKVETGFLRSSRWELVSLLKKSGFKNIQVQPYAVIPSRIGDILPFIYQLNKLLIKVPLVNLFSAFTWIKAYKK